MNKKNLTIISILLAGCVFSVAYGASTVITDSSITTTNLTVTGTCTGCGATEGGFTNYNTIFMNTTSTGADTEFCKILVGNDGSVLINGNSVNHYINPSGTTLFSQNANGCTAAVGWDVSESSSGIYQTILNATSPGSVHVYKNHVFLQKLGIKQSQFSGGGFKSSFGTVGISPDGHYIALAGQDSSGTSDRVVVFQGS